jgi:hypothetical protein
MKCPVCRVLKRVRLAFSPEATFIVTHQSSEELLCRLNKKSI